MSNTIQQVQNPEVAQTALSQIAAGGDAANDWEIYHDPTTGVMRMAPRGAETPIDARAVTTIAVSGFSGTH